MYEFEIDGPQICYYIGDAVGDLQGGGPLLVRQWCKADGWLMRIDYNGGSRLA